MTLQYSSYIDLLRPMSRKNAFIFDILMVLSGSLILALASQVSVRLSISPIPITLQTLAVLLIGATMGSKRGASAILLYIVEGASGMPVFAGGLSGIAYMLGPTGGYLLGFVAAAYVVGFCAERGYDRHVVTTFIILAIGNAITYTFGLLWLAFYVEKSLALQMGLFPFITGDVLKIVMASLILPSGWALVNRK